MKPPPSPRRKWEAAPWWCPGDTSSGPGAGIAFLSAIPAVYVSIVTASPSELGQLTEFALWGGYIERRTLITDPTYSNSRVAGHAKVARAV